MFTELGGVGLGVEVGLGVGWGLLGVGVGEGPRTVDALTPPHPAITSAAAAQAREKASFLRLKKVMVEMILDVTRKVADKTSGMGKWASSATKETGERHASFASYCARPCPGGQRGALLIRKDAAALARDAPAWSVR